MKVILSTVILLIATFNMRCHSAYLIGIPIIANPKEHDLQTSQSLIHHFK